MRNIFSKVSFVLAGIIGALTFYVGFKAYFIIQVDGDVIKDGWGREVYDAPWYLGFLNIYTWPGLKWHLFDLVGFWIIIGIIAGLIAFGSKNKR